LPSPRSLLADAGRAPPLGQLGLRVEHAALRQPVEPPVGLRIDPALVAKLPEVTPHAADDANPSGLRRRPRVQCALAAAMTTPPAFRPLRGSVAGPTAGDALHGPLLDDVLPDEIANPVPGDRVEDVVLDLRVGRDPDAVDADAQDGRRQGRLIVVAHSVTIRFRTGRLF